MELKLIDGVIHAEGSVFDENGNIVIELIQKYHIKL